MMPVAHFKAVGVHRIILRKINYDHGTAPAVPELLKGQVEMYVGKPISEKYGGVAPCHQPIDFCVVGPES